MVIGCALSATDEARGQLTEKRSGAPLDALCQALAPLMAVAGASSNRTRRRRPMARKDEQEDALNTARLVFDGRCGFCTRSVGWLRRIDRHRRIHIVPLQTPGAPDSVGATETECLDSLQWQGGDGSRLSGAAAANAALATALGSRLPMLLYRLTAALQQRCYVWVAENRYRLPGVRPHCETAPSECHQ